MLCSSKQVGSIIEFGIGVAGSSFAPRYYIYGHSEHMAYYLLPDGRWYDCAIDSGGSGYCEDREIAELRLQDFLDQRSCGEYIGSIWDDM